MRPDSAASWFARSPRAVDSRPCKVVVSPPPAVYTLVAAGAALSLRADLGRRLRFSTLHPRMGLAVASLARELIRAPCAGGAGRPPRRRPRATWGAQPAAAVCRAASAALTARCKP